MNNIKTKMDVLQWAKTIVDGKGDRYIPLGKADMFAIAKFISYGEENLTDNLEVTDIPPPEPKVERPAPEEKPAETPDEKIDAEKKQTETVKSVPVSPDTTKVTMTRGYALHKAGFSTQEAYDKFLEWSKQHPKEGMVMDFSTGAKSSNAAFAYWLMENIVEEIPNSEMRFGN